MKKTVIIIFLLYFNLEILLSQVSFFTPSMYDTFYKSPNKLPSNNTINNSIHNTTKYSIEKLSIQFELQELNNIKNEVNNIYIEENINAIKESHLKIEKELKENKHDNNYITILYNKEDELLNQITIQKNYLDKFIKEYEDNIYKLLAGQYLENFNKNNEKIIYKKTNQLCISLSKLYKELISLDKKINIIKKEESTFKDSFKKNNTIITNQNNTENKIQEINASKKNTIFLEENNIFLDACLEKISIFNYKLQQKILETKKKYIKENIKHIKSYFSQKKHHSDIDNINFQKEKNFLIEMQKKLTSKKNEIVELLEKNQQRVNIHYLNDKELEKKATKIIDMINSIEHNSHINDLLTLFELIKIDIININLMIINGKIYINKKNLELIEGWHIFWQPEINNHVINNAIKSSNPIIIKNNNNDLKIELRKYSKRIGIYTNFLNTFMQIENTNNNLKNYKSQAKIYFDGLNEKSNEIIILLDSIKNLFYIASILQEELKIKNFWARSEYSISFLKLKNFIPEIKLFIFELKEKFFPLIKNSFEKITNLNQHTVIDIFVYLFFLILIIGSAYLYKRTFKKIAIFIDNIEQQSYHMRKMNFFVSILSNRNIIFYIWLNVFICIYNKIFSFYYIDTLFYLFSIPIALYFINILLNNFFYDESLSEGYDKEVIVLNYINNFFYKKLLLYTIIFLFFIRQSFLSLIQGNAHEIILAAQFILIQIQLIILLKKNYIIQCINDIKLFNDNTKNFISQYYQLFIALLVTLIVMSNPYVGYGYQMLYILSRSILTFILIPIFNLIFNFIKKKSLYVFFNFEDGEAKNKIKMGKILYISFLSVIYFIICSFSIFIILKLWGYSIQLNAISNLFYENLLPNQEILSHEAITSLSINTLFTVFFYILKGYFFSYCINNFVCAKILNPIVIGQTMQNTIMTLFKYIIVCSCFIIGLCTAGLQSIITKLGALIIALSFALKEPVADFISYFIILIQCPIKVGDVIKINKEGGGPDIEVIGIVRAINSRTTIIRQKNSQTIIVPNSIIIKRSICNWTYHQSGFTAIEDFFITIDRKHDAELVKNILIKIIESYPPIIKNPIPLIRCENITIIGYDFLIRAYINIERAADQWDIASHLRILITKKLDIEQINFAIPEYKIKMQSKIEDIDL